MFLLFSFFVCPPFLLGFEQLFTSCLLSLTTPHLCPPRLLLSCPCLKDSVIFLASVNTADWVFLLKWGMWLTSCIFLSIPPSPSMYLMVLEVSASLMLHLILSFPYPFKWTPEHILTLLMFSFCTEKWIHNLPLTLKEWKLMGCLYTGSQLLVTSINFSFFPVYGCQWFLFNSFYILHCLCNLYSSRTVS